MYIARTDIAMSGTALEVKGFSQRIVYFMNEPVAHNTVADKLKRTRALGGTKQLAATHQQMIAITSPVGGLLLMK